MQRSTPAFTLLLLMACTGDSGLKVHNDPPSVTITSPPANGVFTEGADVTFYATVSDTLDHNDELTYFWSVDGAAISGEQSIFDDGVQLYVAGGVGIGDHVLELLVTDTSSESGDDSVSFSVTPNTAPEIAILSPADGGRYPNTDPLLFEIAVSDLDEASVTDLVLEWDGVSDDLSAAPTTPDADGIVSFYLSDLAIGSHALSVSVSDSHGARTTATTAYEIANADTDGDGFEGLDWGGDDCDDDNAAINPDATEECDGVDNDCDASVDESGTDAPIWYADDDGDTYGDPADTTSACETPPGYTGDASDCDDTAPNIHPGADEYCNSLDDDCDGLIDEDAVDPPTWYLDADGDAYGDVTITAVGCIGPAGYVADGTDCDDTVATTNPGADEYCDGVDNDCDGYTDEDDAVDGGSWYVDDDGDGYGDTTSLVGGCSQPSGTIDIGGDCDDTDTSISPDAAEVCDGVDNDCDGATDEEDAIDGTLWYADADGDGFGDAASTTTACTPPAGYTGDDTDCDDTDATISPDGQEICDDANADEDCDGDVDDADASAIGQGTWYRDADSDGYGTSTVTATACDQPASYVTNDDDCADTDATISPDADEVCDGTDNDCDGLADDDDPGRINPYTWYRDYDGDAYGDPSVTTEECYAPSGYVGDSQDCNDYLVEVNPEGTEDCATSYDDDCDGLTDEQDADNCTSYYGDSDLDGYAGGTGQCWCSAPTSLPYSTADDCDDADIDVHPGGYEVCEDGVDSDCDGIELGCPLEGDVTVADADARLLGWQASLYAGTKATRAGDLDGDGLADLVVASYTYSTYTGTILVVHGGTISGDYYLNDNDSQINGAATNEYFAFSLAGGQDVNGDGLDDLIAGAYYNDTLVANGGGAWLFFGDTPGGVASPSSADVAFYGSDDADWAGVATTLIGDMDGDGLAEAAVGAYGDEDGGNNAGAVFLFYDPAAGSYDLETDADVKIVGENESDYAGEAMDRAGDFDGDGQDDLLIGAENQNAGGSNAGAAYVLTGYLSGTVDLSAADLKMIGEATEDQAGSQVSDAGDINDDGYDDVLIASPNNDENGANAGAAYLVLGNQTGTWYLSSAYGKLYGEVAGAGGGSSMDAAGDVDSDGHDDIIVGAWRDTTTGASAGAVYLFYGPVAGGIRSLAEAEFLIRADDAGDELGVAVAGVGDSNGDSFSDLLLCASDDDTGGTNAGSCYIFLGGER